MDVLVSNLDAKSYENREDADVILSMENNKREKYEDDCHDIRRTFSPFVVSVDGFQGISAISIQRQIAILLAKKWRRPFPAVQEYVKARISISIVRASNRCIRGSRIPAKLISSNRQSWEDGLGLSFFDS